MDGVVCSLMDVFPLGVACLPRFLAIDALETIESGHIGEIVGVIAFGRLSAEFTAIICNGIVLMTGMHRFFGIVEDVGDVVQIFLASDIVGQRTMGAAVEDRLCIAADGHEVCLLFGFCRVFTQGLDIVFTDDLALGQIPRQLRHGIHIPLDQVGTGIGGVIWRHFVELGQIDMQMVVAQHSAPEIIPVVGLQLPEFLVHLVTNDIIQAVRSVCAVSGFVQVIHGLLGENIQLVQHQLGVLLDAQLGLHELLVEAVGIMGTENGGPQTRHIEDLPLRLAALLLYFGLFLIRAVITDGDGVDIGAVGCAQPEQGLDGVVADVHHHFVGIAQGPQHDVVEAVIVLIQVCGVGFNKVFLFAEDVLLDAVLDMVDVDRLFRQDGDASVAHMLLHPLDQYFLIIGGTCFGVVDGQEVTGLDPLLLGHIGGLVHADVDDVADVVQQILFGLGILLVFLDPVFLDQDAHAVTTEALHFLHLGRHEGVEVDHASAGLVSVHETVHGIDHQGVFAGVGIVVAVAQDGIDVVADFFIIGRTDIIRRIVFSQIIGIFIGSKGRKRIVVQVGDFLIIGETVVLKIRKMIFRIHGQIIRGILSPAVFGLESQTIIFKQLSAPGETVDVLFQLGLLGAFNLVRIFFSRVVLAFIRYLYVVCIWHHLARQSCKILAQGAVGQFDAGDDMFEDTLVIADGQDQLAQGHGHAELVEHIGVFNGYVHDDQVGDLHLLADAVADHVIGCRVGIGTDDIDLVDVLPIAGGHILGQFFGSARMCHAQDPGGLRVDKEVLFQRLDVAFQSPLVHDIGHVGEVHDDKGVDLVDIFVLCRPFFLLCSVLLCLGSFLSLVRLLILLRVRFFQLLLAVQLFALLLDVQLLGAVLAGHEAAPGIDAVFGGNDAVIRRGHGGFLMFVVHGLRPSFPVISYVYCIIFGENSKHFAEIYTKCSKSMFGGNGWLPEHVQLMDRSGFFVKGRRRLPKQEGGAGKCLLFDFPERTVRWRRKRP